MPPQPIGRSVAQEPWLALIWRAKGLSLCITMKFSSCKWLLLLCKCFEDLEMIRGPLLPREKRGGDMCRSRPRHWIPDSSIGPRKQQRGEDTTKHSMYQDPPGQAVWRPDHRWFLGTCCHQEAPVRECWYGIYSICLHWPWNHPNWSAYMAVPLVVPGIGHPTQAYDPAHI